MATDSSENQTVEPEGDEQAPALPEQPIAQLEEVDEAAQAVADSIEKEAEAIVEAETAKVEDAPEPVKKAKEQKAKEAGEKADSDFDKLLKTVKNDDFYGAKPSGKPPKKKAKELAKGEFEMNLPTRLRDRTIVYVTVKWKAPAKGKWHIATSARSARWFHVVPDEGQPGAGKTLCMIRTDSWMGVRVEDKQQVPITCPFCLARMLHSGMVTEGGQRQVFDRYQNKLRREAEATAKKEAEKAPASA